MIEGMLIPALVAAVVAFGVEYAAKPRLEVRKDRVVERHRAVRELSESFAALLAMRATLSAFTEIGRWPGLLDSEIERARKLTERARDSLLTAALRLPDDVTTGAAWIIGDLKGTLERLSATSEDTLQRDLDNLARAISNTGPIVDYLLAPSWQLTRRGRALGSIREIRADA